MLSKERHQTATGPWPLAWSARKLGIDHKFAPGTSAESYVLSHAFEENRLTCDPEMYAYLTRQATELPDHQIGGPSLGWLLETLKETRSLAKVKSPELPCLVYCGTKDEVIDRKTILTRMSGWNDGTLIDVPLAKHDLLSETPELRQNVLNGIVLHFGNANHAALSRTGKSNSH